MFVLNKRKKSCFRWANFQSRIINSRDEFKVIYRLGNKFLIKFKI